MRKFKKIFIAGSVIVILMFSTIPCQASISPSVTPPSILFEDFNYQKLLLNNFQNSKKEIIVEEENIVEESSIESVEVVIEEEIVNTTDEPICADENTEYGDYYYDTPDTSEPWTYLGNYTVTFFTYGNGATGAAGTVLTPWYSCAMPGWEYLGHTFYVDGFGYLVCEDISPDGIFDIYVGSEAEIPSYGWLPGTSIYMVN